MAFRTWAKLLAATLGVAALTGACQLGLAYGLGIVRLTRVLTVTTRDQWTAQLAWVAWFPMLAAVIGALVGAMLLRQWSTGTRRTGVGTELALAFSAALGAGVVVPLTMQPARTAQVAGVNPVVVIAICAGLGALVGVFAAWAALAQAVARWSLLTMGAAVWLIALVSVAPSLAPSDPLPAVRLGVFDAGFLSPAVTQRTAQATMPALALLIGAALGWLARRRELPTLTIALAGLPGPALLTIAYLVAGPGAGDDRYQVVPYWAAMTATGAGVLGSVLAAVLRRGPGPEDEEDDGRDPAEEKPPLPKRTAEPDSAIAAAGAPPVSPAAPAAPRPVDTGVFDLPPTTRPRASDLPPATHSGESDLPPATRPGVSDLPPAVRPGADPLTGRPRGADEAGRSADGPVRPGAAPLTGRPDEVPPLTGRHGATDSGPEPSEGAHAAGLGGPAAKPEKPRRRGRRSSVADAFIGRTGEFPAARPGGTSGTAVGEHASGGAPWSPATPEPKPYVPEPATRPLPPEVLHAPTAEQPRPSGGRLGRSLRPFSRGRVAEPLTPEPTAVSAPLPHPEPITPPLPVVPAPRQDPPAEAADGKRKPKGKKDEDYVDWVSGLGK